MSDLIIQNHQLPTKINDLAKFILIGQEKLVSVRAEIRAITKLGVAKEVIDQKVEEHRGLSEALLDAQVRMGELMKELPKANKWGTGNKENKIRTGENLRKDEIDTVVDLTNPIPTSEDRFNITEPYDTSVAKLETKSQAIKDLGFSQKQAERFQTLADNKEIVEEVKAEARFNNEVPTRSKVLQLVKERKAPIQVNSIDKKYNAADEIHDAITKISLLKIDTEKLADWLEVMEEGEKDFYLEEIDTALEKMRNIKAYLTNPRNQKKAR